MTPQEAQQLAQGLRVAAAHLREDEVAEERLLAGAVQRGELPTLIEGFVYAALAACELLARARSRPFQQALREVEEMPDVVLVPGVGVGPWGEILDLASAVKRSHAEAQRTRNTMDPPQALNASFRLAVSALTALSRTRAYQHMTPAQIAEMLVEQVEQGRY